MSASESVSILQSSLRGQIPSKELPAKEASPNFPEVEDPGGEGCGIRDPERETEDRQREGSGVTTEIHKTKKKDGKAARSEGVKSSLPSQALFPEPKTLPSGGRAGSELAEARGHGCRGRAGGPGGRRVSGRRGAGGRPRCATRRLPRRARAARRPGGPSSGRAARRGSPARESHCCGGGRPVGA
jgi:hypothetical protein